MKKLIVIIIILSWLLCSCSSQEAMKKISNNPKESSVLEEYKAIMKNEVRFASTDDRSNIYLNDLLSKGGSGYDVELEVTHFAILDMDGDNIPEVVVKLSVVGNEWPDFYEVLHYMNNTIYGYFRVYRALAELKADGTFFYSCGAGDWGYAKLRFTLNACEDDKLGYCESSVNNESYFVYSKPSTAEAFESFCNEQDRKKDAVWYEFSQENIEIALSRN